MLDHVIGEGLRISQNAVVTYGTRVHGVDVFFKRGCRRADKVANNALHPHGMLCSRMCLQALPTFEFFLAKFADDGAFAVRVGRDTFCGLGARRANDRWTWASERSEDSIGRELRLTVVRLSLLMCLLEMVIPLDEGGGHVTALRTRELPVGGLVPFQFSKRVECYVALAATMDNTLLSRDRLVGYRVAVHGS
jgi:hypothetical protein